MRARAVAVALVLGVTPAGLRAQTSDVALGLEALARRDVRAADAAFARASTGSDALLRASGFQWRGHLAWKIRGDTASAVRYLQQALEAARDSSMVMLEIARLSGARGRYREAVRTAYEAMQRSGDAERRGLVARTLIQLSVDGAFAGPRGSVKDSLEARILRTVLDTMTARVERFPGRAVDALELIHVGALLADTTAIRVGYTSYFLLCGEWCQPERFLGTMQLRIAQRYPDAMTRARLTAQALQDGHLIETAAVLLRAVDARGNDTLQRDAWQDNLLGYAEFARALRSDAERSYQAALGGVPQPGAINRSFARRGRELWPRLRWPRAGAHDYSVAGPAPPYVPARLAEYIAFHFSATLSIERSASIDELHLAHHGSPAKVAGGVLVPLEENLASGLDAWLLDGAGGRGAWVSHDTIYARRSAFTETPFRAWLALTDPQSMPGEAFRLNRDSIGDILRAQRDSLGYLPGVAARMLRDGGEQLLDSLRAVDSLDDRGRQIAFTREMFDNLIRTSVLLHEGRHLADVKSGRSGPGSAVDDEFRAKIAEVTGAAHPKLALTAILSPNIGDASSHGQANRRVMRGLNRWIRVNGSRITGYDPAVPALLQLPLLTDDQLRAAFQSLRQ